MVNPEKRKNQVKIIIFRPTVKDITITLYVFPTSSDSWLSFILFISFFVKKLLIHSLTRAYWRRGLIFLSLNNMKFYFETALILCPLSWSYLIAYLSNFISRSICIWTEELLVWWRSSWEAFIWSAIFELVLKVRFLCANFN